MIFKSKLHNGFFIEAGADDLITDSNTLFFEIERSWTGILIEPALWEKRFLGDLKIVFVIFLYRQAIKRNAWCAPVCLGLHAKPHFAPFTANPFEGGMAGLIAEEREDTTQFQCFPFARSFSTSFHASFLSKCPPH